MEMLGVHLEKAHKKPPVWTGGFLLGADDKYGFLLDCFY